MNEERNKEISGLFNSWAGAKRGEDMAKGHDELVLNALNDWTFREGDSLLDIGCGNGRALQLAWQHGAGRLAGIDLSEKMIGQAGLNVPEADLRTGRAEALPWEDDSFTHILSVEAFYYLEDPLQGLKEIRRVLKPGGRLAIIIDFYKESKGTHSWQDNFSFDMQLLSEKEWSDLMFRAGFDTVKASRVIRRKELKDRENFQASAFFPTYELYADYMKSGALKLTN